jgi:tetratricopeptide (TPR) repeat protein
MADHPPTVKLGRAVVFDALLARVLAAQRDGSLAELLRQNQRIARRLGARFLGIVAATAGSALPADADNAQAVTLALRWAFEHLRPDRGAGAPAIDRDAWLDRTSWRPLLATACHYRFLSVPDFPDRYRRRTDEQAADNLCGLWAVGPSTFYRYLDKGRRHLVELMLQARTQGAQRQSLRRFVHEHAMATLSLHDEDARARWHFEQADRANAARDPASALWHVLRAGAADHFVQLLHLYRTDLARHCETDLMVEALAQQALADTQRFALAMARAALWRHRGDEARELDAYDAALRIATRSNDLQGLGEAYSALGKFHELRDADRAFACYEDSVRYLGEANAQQGTAPSEKLLATYVATLVRLGWLHVTRNDPRAQAVLERAEQLRAAHPVPDDAAAMLEQAWGEYWRRAGDLRRALECKHRALNIFERIGDRRSVIVTYFNLSLLYGEVKEFERSIDYAQRVLSLEGKVAIEPESLVSTHGNLGVTYFWQGQYDAAIGEYKLALALCEKTGLRTPLNTLHYNLAEAHYKRFQLHGEPEDERRGDMHAAIAAKAKASEKDPSHREATLRLKAEILGSASAGSTYDRLLPGEFAAHFEEMATVQRSRAALALPASPQEHIRAHLAAAQAYLAIAGKERESAQRLVERHCLHEQFRPEFEALRQTFERELTREQLAAARWREQAADLMRDESRVAAVLAELFGRGDINKSRYAKVCGLGLATASKHLGELAARGLLVQTGKGPTTRYRLPA